MINLFHDTKQVCEVLMEQVARQTEDLLAQDLNAFVKKGLLRVVTGPVTLVQNPMSTDIEVRTQVKFELRDKEYIAELEKKISELESMITDMQALLLARSLR